MMVNTLPWYYLPSPLSSGTTITLAGDEWHHCHHVLRMKSGNELIICNGSGFCFHGIIRSTAAKEGQIELLEDASASFQSDRTYKVSIGFAPTKNLDRTEFAVEKITELGVEEIFFLQCDHSERTHLRLDRMEKIIIAAAKQSRKLLFPRLSPQVTLKQVIARKSSERLTEYICCHLANPSRSIAQNYLPMSDVCILVGPEGGFSEKEITEMRDQVKFVHLGPHRLRVETAVITACANIHLLNEMNMRS
jgi:16S rRNA (uracil1498-N3)-methyltransferase